MAVEHGVTLPVADCKPGFNLRRTLLDPGAVRDFAETCTLRLLTLISAPLRLATIGPKVTAGHPITLNQRVDPLAADSNAAANARHHARDLIWTPVLADQVTDPMNQ